MNIDNAIRKVKPEKYKNYFNNSYKLKNSKNLQPKLYNRKRKN